MEEKKNYKTTLNLPQTAFAMEAKLTANEPSRLKRWNESHLYEKLMAARAGGKKWVLHDGPPFANGDIHIGHVINKTLKDIILRFRSMQGFQTPYVPGWDCHGLPIEHKALEVLRDELKKDNVVRARLDTKDVRHWCRQYADRYVKIQSEQFQRLGILGQWNDPYLTMSNGYEAATLEVFARFVENNLVYKKLKPVPWSIENQTALADAELEYKDIEDPSIYVEFRAIHSDHLMSLADLDPDDPVYYLVWTTTPWTLPANLAIAIHPEIEYAFVRYRKFGDTSTNVPRVGVLARELVESVFNRPGVERLQDLGGCHGRDFFTDANPSSGLQYEHPFLPDARPLVIGTYITTTDGTGLVHTAPGHGEDDYETGIQNQLSIYSPVKANGKFDDTVPIWLRAKSVKEGNQLIIDQLRESNHLLALQNIVHSYPHDWRSKKPIIFRATEQWFVGMDTGFGLPSDPEEYGKRSLRRRALSAVGFDPAHPFTAEQQRMIAENDEANRQASIEAMQMDQAGEKPAQSAPEVIKQQLKRLTDGLNYSYVTKFIPDWGRNRLRAMLETRPDWCVSRQRAWGLPIPVFYNESGEALLTPQSVRAVAKRFAEKGSDAWFTESPAELLGDFDPGPNFPKDRLRKEKDIFDVWFESGSSWHAVLQSRKDLDFPADLYLEGSDQHRGWFQLSLLPSLVVTGKPPFRQVLTHGFVVKPDGTKVSKSDKDYVTATQEINKHGADLLRLWCSSVDYQNDIPASPAAIQEFGDKYRKIRNTLRFLLSNLYDFDPKTDATPIDTHGLDGWALYELDQLIRETKKEYDAYQLHRVFRRLHDFCAVQVSTIYSTAMKDRLYCELPNSPLRRRCQRVMYYMADALIRLLAPILVFTADEAWEHLPHKTGEDADAQSVHLLTLPTSEKKPLEQDLKRWALLREARDQATSQLDAMKKSVGLNKALDAEIVYHASDETRKSLELCGADLEDVVGAGCHSFVKSDGNTWRVEVVDVREKYKACARSWKRRPDVGQDSEYPDLSQRDAAAVRTLASK